MPQEDEYLMWQSLRFFLFLMTQSKSKWYNRIFFSRRIVHDWTTIYLIRDFNYFCKLYPWHGLVEKIKKEYKRATGKKWSTKELLRQMETVRLLSYKK